MNYFESVQLLLCDLATKVYKRWICMTFLCKFDKCEVYVVVSDDYWSSSSNVNNSSNAWNVNFNNGNDNTNNKNNNNYVRCVRERKNV